jgi:hypothetical protein
MFAGPIICLMRMETKKNGPRSSISGAVCTTWGAEWFQLRALHLVASGSSPEPSTKLINMIVHLPGKVNEQAQY